MNEDGLSTQTQQDDSGFGLSAARRDEGTEAADGSRATAAIKRAGGGTHAPAPDTLPISPEEALGNIITELQELQQFSSQYPLVLASAAEQHQQVQRKGHRNRRSTLRLSTDTVLTLPEYTSYTAWQQQQLAVGQLQQNPHYPHLPQHPQPLHPQLLEQQQQLERQELGVNRNSPLPTQLPLAQRSYPQRQLVPLDPNVASASQISGRRVVQQTGHKSSNRQQTGDAGEDSDRPPDYPDSAEEGDKGAERGLGSTSAGDVSASSGDHHLVDARRDLMRQHTSTHPTSHFASPISNVTAPRRDHVAANGESFLTVSPPDHNDNLISPVSDMSQSRNSILNPASARLAPLSIPTSSVLSPFAAHNATFNSPSTMGGSPIGPLTGVPTALHAIKPPTDHPRRIKKSNHRYSQSQSYYSTPYNPSLSLSVAPFHSRAPHSNHNHFPSYPSHFVSSPLQQQQHPHQSHLYQDFPPSPLHRQPQFGYHQLQQPRPQKKKSYSISGTYRSHSANAATFASSSTSGYLNPFSRNTVPDLSNPAVVAGPIEVVGEESVSGSSESDDGPSDPYLDALLARSVQALEMSNVLLHSSISTQKTGLSTISSGSEFRSDEDEIERSPVKKSAVPKDRQRKKKEKVAVVMERKPSKGKGYGERSAIGDRYAERLKNRVKQQEETWLGGLEDIKRAVEGLMDEVPEDEGVYHGRTIPRTANGRSNWGGHSREVSLSSSLPTSISSRTLAALDELDEWNEREYDSSGNIEDSYRRQRKTPLEIRQQYAEPQGKGRYSTRHEGGYTIPEGRFTTPPPQRYHHHKKGSSANASISTTQSTQSSRSVSTAASSTSRLNYSPHRRSTLVAPAPRALTQYIEASMDPNEIALPSTLGLRSSPSFHPIPLIITAPESQSSDNNEVPTSLLVPGLFSEVAEPDTISALNSPETTCLPELTNLPVSSPRRSRQQTLLSPPRPTALFATSPSPSPSPSPRVSPSRNGLRRSSHQHGRASASTPNLGLAKSNLHATPVEPEVTKGLHSATQLLTTPAYSMLSSFVQKAPVIGTTLTSEATSNPPQKVDPIATSPSRFQLNAVGNSLSTASNMLITSFGRLKRASSFADASNTKSDSSSLPNEVDSGNVSNRSSRRGKKVSPPSHLNLNKSWRRSSAPGNFLKGSGPAMMENDGLSERSKAATTDVNHLSGNLSGLESCTCPGERTERPKGANTSHHDVHDDSVTGNSVNEIVSLAGENQTLSHDNIQADIFLPNHHNPHREPSEDSEICSRHPRSRRPIMSSLPPESSSTDTTNRWAIVSSSTRNRATAPHIEIEEASSLSSDSSDGCPAKLTVISLRKILDDQAAASTSSLSGESGSTGSGNKGKLRAPSFMPCTHPIATYGTSTATASISKLFTKGVHTSSTRPPSPPRQSAMKRTPSGANVPKDGETGPSNHGTPIGSMPPTPRNNSFTGSLSSILPLAWSGSNSNPNSERSTPKRISFAELPESYASSKPEGSDSKLREQREERRMKRKKMQKEKLARERGKGKARADGGADEPEADGLNWWINILSGGMGGSGGGVNVFSGGLGGGLSLGLGIGMGIGGGNASDSERGEGRSSMSRRRASTGSVTASPMKVGLASARRMGLDEWAV